MFCRIGGNPEVTLYKNLVLREKYGLLVGRHLVVVIAAD